MASIRAGLLERLAKLLDMPGHAIDTATPLEEYGLDSLAAVTFTGDLEEWLEQRLPPTLVWDCETVDALAEHLANDGASLVAGDRAGLAGEYARLEHWRETLDAPGLGNPYLRLHERVTGSTTFVAGRELVDFSSYNYLSLSGDPFISRAAKEAIDLYGTSVSASRLASGERPIHQTLERELAEFIGAESCMVFVGGHATNVTVIGHLFRRGDLILHDVLIHNSVQQGAMLSGASRRLFPHNDWRALDRILDRVRRQHARVLVVIEGLYSMDGDIPDLPRFLDVTKRHEAMLMVDEAHSLGVLGEHGRGIAEHFGVDAREVDVWMGSLSKSFASCGGYIAGGDAMVQYLKYSAPGFVYSVGMSPPNAAAALAALTVLRAEPERVARLRDRSRMFRDLAATHDLESGAGGDVPIVPLIVGDSAKCVRLSQALFARGINVLPVVPPAVPPGAARLRFFVTSSHTDDQIRAAIEAVAEELSKV